MPKMAPGLREPISALIRLSCPKLRPNRGQREMKPLGLIRLTRLSFQMVIDALIVTYGIVSPTVVCEDGSEDCESNIRID